MLVTAAVGGAVRVWRFAATQGATSTLLQHLSLGLLSDLVDFSHVQEAFECDSQQVD